MPGLSSGSVAQRLEPAAHNGLVAGSNPSAPTIFLSLKDATLVTLKTTLDVPALDCPPMSREETATFVRCCAIDTNATDATAAETTKLFRTPLPFALAILLKRIEVHAPELPLRGGVVMCLACMCDNPAKAVMWAFYLVKRTRALGHSVTMHDLAQDFPYGFPADDAMSTLWDDQKGYKHGLRNDNLLDTAAPWAVESAS